MLIRRLACVVFLVLRNTDTVPYARYTSGQIASTATAATAKNVTAATSKITGIPWASAANAT